MQIDVGIKTSQALPLPGLFCAAEAIPARMNGPLIPRVAVKSAEKCVEFGNVSPVREQKDIPVFVFADVRSAGFPGFPRGILAAKDAEKLLEVGVFRKKGVGMPRRIQLFESVVHVESIV